MKNLILILALSASALQAQIAPNPSTNSGATPPPVNPGQSTQPYNGTNPTGQPNQLNTYSTTTPATPGNNNSNYQPTVQPNPVVPTTPVNPAVPNINKNPYNNTNRLYQDPVRTPSDPKQVDHIKTRDGSTGKYHKPKKAMSGKTFAHNHSRVKTAKHHGNSEKSRAPATSETR